MAMQWSRESLAKQIHDPFFTKTPKRSYNKPIIVGAGPSGLAVAACLKQKGIQSIIIERSSCIASLWQHRTYDRLRLHLPKQFCELPLMPFPPNYPKYPSKQQFISYLEAYRKKFDIRPVFNESAVSAEFDKGLGLWRVTTSKNVYVSSWLVVATGENADVVLPEVEGMDEFEGKKIHVSAYRNGEEFKGKKVLVVGCGNSGMEVCLDLCNHLAMPSIVVRDSVHVLPQEMLGLSTFGLSMSLLKWLPMDAVDKILLFMSWLLIGDTEKLGLKRPKLGPLQLKSMSGKTPVLDVGTLDKIKSGDIKVRPAIRRLIAHGVNFVDGKLENYDAIVFATGYKSNAPAWLKDRELFSSEDGYPKKPFPNGWKGEQGLYAVGFTKRGLLGTSMDARRIADDIEKCLKSDLDQSMFLP